MSPKVKNITEEFWQDLFSSDYYKNRSIKISRSLEEFFDNEGSKFEEEAKEEGVEDLDEIVPSISQYFNQAYSFDDLFIFNYLGDIVCAHCKKCARPNALVSQPYNLEDNKGKYRDTILWCSDCIVTHWNVLAPKNILENLNCSANAQQRIEYWGLNGDRFAEILSAGSPETRLEAVKNLDCFICEEILRSKIKNKIYYIEPVKTQRFTGDYIASKETQLNTEDGYASFIIGHGGW